MPKQPQAPSSPPDTWPTDHGDALYRYAYFHAHDTSLAEDLVQETLLAALTARERFSGRSSERTWLIAILKNKLVDQVRKQAREQPLAEYAENDDEAVEALFAADGHWKRPPSLWETPMRALEQKQFWQVLAHCIAGLPVAQAHAFRLCEIVGREGNEACKVLGISATNLWVLLHRARLRLRQCLEIQWFGREAKVKR